MPLIEESFFTPVVAHDFGLGISMGINQFLKIISMIPKVECITGTQGF
jgi:hypothetical protein